MVERLTIEQESEHLKEVMGEFADVVQHPSEYIEAVAEQRVLGPIKGFFCGMGRCRCAHWPTRTDQVVARVSSASKRSMRSGLVR